MKVFTAIVFATAIFGTSPAIAQRSYPEPFREYSKNVAYLDFSIQPNICNGQILDKGLICIKDITKETKYAKRVAFIRLLFNLGNDAANIITIQTFELEPNNSNVAYKVIIRRTWFLSKSDVPLLLVFVKKDGSVAVDTTYGDFPPQYSAEKESYKILEEYKGEIRKLIAVLNKAR
jgi:hypothetical protein